MDHNGTCHGTTSAVSNVPYRIERPKLLFCAKTQTFVMWFHLDDAHFSMKMVGVATSKTIAGNYTFLSGFRPDGNASFDMGLFQEPNGDAWLVRSVHNRFAGFSKLSADFLNTTGIVSKAPKCEGQAAWWSNASGAPSYYMVCSHLTGWSPNPMLFLSTPAPMGSGGWRTLPDNPCPEHTTWNSQSSFVFSYTHPSGGELLIYMGDRWNIHGPGSVGNASYVWLPLVHNGSHTQRGHVEPAVPRYQMPYLPSWRVADFAL